MNLNELNSLETTKFVDYLREVFEHSPWVISASAKERPFVNLKALQVSLEKALYAAPLDAQVALIRAHPDLAVKLERIDKLTDFSQMEQKQAGFEVLAPDILEEMRHSLAVYRAKFGHPFILCVSDHATEDILPILNVRVTASADSERLSCLFQITRIAWHRICSLVEKPS